MSVPGFGAVLGCDQPWPAPAKLNLFLHIVGRRADGYHLLQTVFQLIDWCDELMFYRRPPGVIERVAGPIEVPPESDLVVRAARLLAAQGGSSFGVGIELRKKLPMQAGLGGGSSDAATVLVALNTLWRLNLSVDALASLGSKLGADIPVFVRGRSAWGEGIGDELTVCDLPEKVFLVIEPGVAVSTARIFQDAELTRNSPVMTIRAFLAGSGRNDCAPTVRRLYPEVAEALDWLAAFAEARLTGSGACVYAGFDDELAALDVFARLPARWRGSIVKGVNHSPVLERLRFELSRQ